MSKSKSELKTLKGAWNPFMCPTCRGLFRAPNGVKGSAECPLCQSEISVDSTNTTAEPEADELASASQVDHPAHDSKAEQPTSESQEEQPDQLKRRRIQKKKANSKESDWASSKDSPSSHSKGSRGLVLSFLVLLLTGLVFCAFFIFKARFPEMSLTSKDQSEQKFQISKFEESSGETNPLDPEIDPTNAEFLKQAPTNLELAEKTAEKFLQCDKIEDLPALIREPDRVMPLIRKFYQDTPFEASGVSSLNQNGIAQIAKKFVSFQVTLKDYSSRPVALEITDDGPKVDWESWVGHCEQPWNSFIENRTNEPTLVRVTIKSDSYYNFSFQDDSKWVCYQLSRGPDDPVISGYLPKDSPLRKELPKPRANPETVILKVRFPDDSISGDQVLITDFVNSGWVFGL